MFLLVSNKSSLTLLIRGKTWFWIHHFFALGWATVNWLIGGCTWSCFGIQKANLSGVSGDTVVTRVVSTILFYVFPRFVGRWSNLTIIFAALDGFIGISGLVKFLMWLFQVKRVPAKYFVAQLLWWIFHWLIFFPDGGSRKMKKSLAGWKNHGPYVETTPQPNNSHMFSIGNPKHKHLFAPISGGKGGCLSPNHMMGWQPKKTNPSRFLLGKKLPGGDSPNLPLC